MRNEAKTNAQTSEEWGVVSNAGERSGKISTSKYQSPLHLLMVIAVSLFMAEMADMFLLGMFPGLPVTTKALLDATILTILASPVLYVFLFRPLTMLIAKCKQAEQSIDLERQRLFSLLNQLPAYVCLRASDYSIRFANNRFKEYFGDPQGKACFEVMCGQRKACAHCPPEQSFGEQACYAWECNRPDARTYQVYEYPFTDTDGSPFTLVLGVDITARKQAEEKLLTYQTQLRSLVSELSLAEARERRRFAMDLHDSIGQLLAMLKLKFDTLRRAPASTPPGEDLDDILGLIKAAIEQTRSLTFELSPPVLYQCGLEAALDVVVEDVQKQHGLSIEVSNDYQPKPLTEDVKVMLFRAVQEVLVNIVKHAQAQHVRLSLSREGEYIQITVVDDGMGFDTSEIEVRSGRLGGFGMFNITERLFHLGGYCGIASKPGQGTEVTLVAPLQHPEDTAQGKRLYGYHDSSSRRSPHRV